MATQLKSTESKRNKFKNITRHLAKDILNPNCDIQSKENIIQVYGGVLDETKRALMELSELIVKDNTLETKLIDSFDYVMIT